jgi:protein phosphatase
MLLKRPKWHGPFDIVGDLHGCMNELLALMAALGYRVESLEDSFAASPPLGRRLVFVGDLVNRGPATPQVLRLVMSMVRMGQALCVPGNQDMKLCTALKGMAVAPTPGLTRSLEQFADEPAEFRAEAMEFLDALPSYCILDDGKLVIAHAGLPEHMQGSNSARARAFALGGETTGETDEFGLAVRCN